MFKKEVILGNFVKKNKILSYLEYIHNEFFIQYKNLFVYNIENNVDEYFVTFKIESEKRNTYKNIKGCTIFHFKQGCVFSINALNQLIDTLNPNIEYKKDFQLDWENYSNKLIILVNDEYQIKNIDKIEDKSIFFN